MYIRFARSVKLTQYTMGGRRLGAVNAASLGVALFHIARS